MLLAKHYQNPSVLIETTNCQSWRWARFFETRDNLYRPKIFEFHRCIHRIKLMQAKLKSGVLPNLNHDAIVNESDSCLPAPSNVHRSLTFSP